MTNLRELATDASLPKNATFADAARLMAETQVTVVAVVEGERVVGLLTADDVLRGLYPGYLDHLAHTSFLSDEALAAQLERAETVDRYMSKPVTVEVDASSAHVAEVFLHCPHAAVALVDRKRYIGIVEQAAFVAALVKAAERP